MYNKFILLCIRTQLYSPYSRYSRKNKKKTANYNTALHNSETLTNTPNADMKCAWLGVVAVQNINYWQKTLYLEVLTRLAHKGLGISKLKCIVTHKLFTINNFWSTIVRKSYVKQSNIYGCASFLPRDALQKRGLCRHVVSVCLCMCVCHVRGSCQNE